MRNTSERGEAAGLQGDGREKQERRERSSSDRRTRFGCLRRSLFPSNIRQ